jgi:hypothetical protein
MLPRKLNDFIRFWKPDIIFTVPDNYHLGWAYLASKRYRIPLAVNFQDLFPLSRFLDASERPYTFVSRFLIRQFRMVDRRADAVFYTSDGMRGWFTSNTGQVLYPIGADLDVVPQSVEPIANVPTVLYAGNCYGGYGRMLLSLCRALENRQDIRLRIFTAGNDWKAEDREHFRRTGTLHDFLPFEQLRFEFERADAFLTVMSFEQEETPFVSTSFTTKWLDYAPFGKPVVVWAPPYSSATIFARRHGCGAVIATSSADLAAQEMVTILNDRVQCATLSKVSREIALGPLNSNEIHAVLVKGLSGIRR